MISDAFTDFSLPTWLIFAICCFAAARIGPFFPKIGLPLVTGYLFAGSLCGYVLGLLSPAACSRLSPVTQFALAFIAFSAGAELYIPELRLIFKRILAMTLLLCAATFFAVLGVTFMLSSSSLLPKVVTDLDGGCRLSIAAIIASIMMARSPASAIAVITELKARGPFTSTALGVTVFCDVFVLLSFALATTVAESSCRPEHEGFSMVALGIMMGTILLSCAIGLAVGRILIMLMVFKRIPARYLILPLGSIIFMASQALTDYSHDSLPYVINLEPLLICITAGFVCSNLSSHRSRFLGVLSLCGPYVFLPFFVLTGATLDLNVLLGSLGFALLLAVLRAACIFVGAGLGGHITGAPPQHSLLAWMTLLTQAGVSLGLASEVGMSFPGWGRAVQTAIIAVVLVNQLAGPVFFKYALRRVGEAGADEGGAGHRDEDAVVPRAVVVVGGGGARSSSERAGLSAAARLLQEGWQVTVAVAGGGEAARESVRARLTAWIRAEEAAAPPPHPGEAVPKSMTTFLSIVSAIGSGSDSSLPRVASLTDALRMGGGDGGSSAASDAARWAPLLGLLQPAPPLSASPPAAVVMCLPDPATASASLVLACARAAAPKRFRNLRLLAHVSSVAWAELLATELGVGALDEGAAGALLLVRLAGAPRGGGAPLTVFPLGRGDGGAAGEAVAVRAACAQGVAAWSWESGGYSGNGGTGASAAGGNGAAGEEAPGVAAEAAEAPPRELRAQLRSALASSKAVEAAAAAAAVGAGGTAGAAASSGGNGGAMTRLLAFLGLSWGGELGENAHYLQQLDAASEEKAVAPDVIVEEKDEREMYGSAHSYGGKRPGEALSAWDA